MDTHKCSNVIEVPIYSPSPGDRIRVAIQYEGAWRPIFWLQVQKDGSIYLSPRYTNISTLRKGLKPLQGGQISIKYQEGQVIADPKVLKNPKVSFHASGITRAGGERLLRESLRTLQEQKLLCFVLFEHPRQFAPVPVSKIKNRDICINYPLDEKCPLAGQLYVAPHRKWKIVQVPSAAYQINLALQFSGIVGTPDLLMQFVLFHGLIGNWPPYSYLIWDMTSIKYDENP